LGEVPVLCVEMAAEVPDLDSVRRACAGRIASFKVPRRVVAVTRFPMTVTGKLQRAELRKLVIEQVAAR